MRLTALHLLSDVLLWLSSTAAPVPREKPPASADLAGAWRYSWAGTPGIMWLNADGSYLALHGEGLTRYEGVWWMDRGRCVIVECAVYDEGRRGPAVRHEFDLRRVPCGYELRRYVTVTLTRGE